MWHVSSRSGVATLRTAIHLLLTYLLTYQQHEHSVTVFKSRLKTFLFSRGFLSSLFSAAHCLAPAPLKLRPRGAIQIRLLLCHIILLLSLLLLLLLFSIIKTTTSAQSKQSTNVALSLQRGSQLVLYIAIQYGNCKY